MQLRIPQRWRRLVSPGLPLLLTLLVVGCGLVGRSGDDPADAASLAQDLAEARADRAASTSVGQPRSAATATRAGLAAASTPGAADLAPAPSSAVDPPTAAADRSPTATGPTAAAPDPASFVGLAVSGGQIGGAYQLVDLRSGEHPGFTRIVWELEAEGGGIPRYEAVEEAVEGGGARIALSISDLYGYAFVGSLSADTPESAIVRGLRPTQSGDDALMRFEVELARPARFTLSALEAPLRLVLDVHEE